MSNDKKKPVKNIREIILLTILGLSLIFFCKYQQNWVLFLGDDNTKLEEEEKKLVLENSELVGKINSIMAQHKLDKLAKDKNFSSPKDNQIINIDMQNYEEQK